VGIEESIRVTAGKARERPGPLGRLTYRLEANIKVDFLCNLTMDFINLGQEQWMTFVMNFRVLEVSGKL
jgi:hypothetical protein